MSQKGDWVNPKTLEIVKQGQVRVASIEWTACTALSRSMGITRLPTVQFFHNGQMVGGVVAGPTKFAQVQQALDHYLSLQSPELDFEAEMERGKTLMEQESGRIFNNQPAVQPHATTTTTTREHSKQVVMSSSSSTATEEAMLVTNESIIINNNASSASTKQESHVVDQRHRASWWNIKGVLAQRRARRAALQDARP